LRVAAERVIVGQTKVRRTRFEVDVEGDPVFLSSVREGRVERVGFFATRRVEAESADQAGRLVCEVVLKELMRKGPRNPPDQPIKIVPTKITALSEKEWAAKRDFDGTFSFFPHEIH
jgi:hypothetical protein